MSFPTPPRLLVIVNPTAGRGGKLGACLEALSARGCSLYIEATQAAGDAERIAREADAGAFDAVIAAGGDGTVHEIVNGLIGKRLPLGLIPLGTANVLAAEIGQDPSPERVAETIASGQRWPVRLGRVGGARFLLMAGAGFDADVVAGIDLALKRRAGKFAYAWRAVTGAFSYPFPPVTVRLDGVARTAFGIVVCRARHYAGGFVVAPPARLDAETVQVCLLKKPGAGNVLRYAAALMIGRLGALADVDIITARTVEIEGPPGAPVQIDGDIRARLPVTIDLAPETIELIVPNGHAPAAG